MTFQNSLRLRLFRAGLDEREKSPFSPKQTTTIRRTPYTYHNSHILCCSNVSVELLLAFWIAYNIPSDNGNISTSSFPHASTPVHPPQLPAIIVNFGRNERKVIWIILDFINLLSKLVFICTHRSVVSHRLVLALALGECLDFVGEKPISFGHVYRLKRYIKLYLLFGNEGIYS